MAPESGGAVATGIILWFMGPARQPLVKGVGPMGPQIVSKAVMLIWTNLGDAARATALPLLLLVLLPMFGVAIDENGESLRLPSPPLLLLLLAIGVALFAWGAVAWHRFVLLEERPGLVPRPDGRAVRGYVWAMLRVGLIGVVIALSVGGALLLLGTVVQSAVGGSGSWVIGLAGFGLGILLSYAVLRFSLVLPAAALGRPMSLGESWRATQEARDTVLVTALLLALLQFVLSLVGQALPLAGLPGVLLSLIAGWASLMVGLSVLTALYGVLVEGRPVD